MTYVSFLTILLIWEEYIEAVIFEAPKVGLRLNTRKTKFKKTWTEDDSIQEVEGFVYNSNDVFDDEKTGAIMWIAVPFTNQNQGIFFHDLNQLLAKNYKHKLNITGHMPPEPISTRLTVALLTHRPNSNCEQCWAKRSIEKLLQI